MRVVLALVLVGAVAAAASGGGRRSKPIERATPERDYPGRVVQRIHTGTRPCATLGAAGSVWVADINDSVVVRLDPATGRCTPASRLMPARAEWPMAPGRSGSRTTPPRVSRASTSLPIDTRTISVGASPYDVTFAGGAAWVTDYASNTVTRIDAATDHTRTITVGNSPVGIAPAAGAVWVANSGQQHAVTDRHRHRRGPHGARSADPRSGPPTPATPCGSATRVVVRSRALDARAGRIVQRVKVGPTPNDGDVYEGSVWFPDKDGALYRLDEKTDTVRGPYALGAGDPFVVSGYAGRLWIADFGGTETFVVDPSKLRLEQLAERVDQQAGQRADDGAVDADELQVAPDLQLEPARRSPRSPSAGRWTRSPLSRLEP